MRKILSVFLAVIMICFIGVAGTIGVSAASKGIISAESVSGKTGDIVTVKINITNNPGIVATMLKVSYDSKMIELIEAKNGDVFKSSAFLAGKNLTAVPYVLTWEDSLLSTNISKDGTLATLKFRISDNAVGKTAIKITVDEGSTFNVDLNSVSFNVVNGKVSVPFTVWQWILYYVCFGWIWM